MDKIDPHTVGHHLNLSADLIAWLGRPRSSSVDLPLPNDAEATSRFAGLEIPPDMWREILRNRPSRTTNPAVHWLAQRACADVVDDMGSGENFVGWPALPQEGEGMLRHVYIWAMVTALPSTRRFHQARGISDEISWRALSTLGTAVRESATVYGKSGLLFGLWVPPLAFRGVHYALGRLAFDIAGKSDGANPDVVELFVHVPGGAKLDPTECDRSFVMARKFMRTHFPECRVDRLVCRSWLLDPQLANYLPATSNIVRFQRRFELAPNMDVEVADHDLLEYVFRRQCTGDIDEVALDQLPQETRLQRAYVDHLRRGKHWHACFGHSQF